MRVSLGAALLAAFFLLAAGCASTPPASIDAASPAPPAQDQAAAPAAQAAPATPAASTSSPEPAASPEQKTVAPSAEEPKALPSPAAVTAALAQAEELVKAGKWNSAYETLTAADPDSLDPQILAKRIELCLRGFIQTDLHLRFALKDLEAGESLEALRDSEAAYPSFEFDPVTLADDQAAAGIEAVPALKKALADYFYEVRSRYEGQWVFPDDEVMIRCLIAYSQAREGGVFDAESLANEGEMLLRLGKPEDAEPLLAQSLALKPSVESTAYNRAVALFLLGRYTEALPAFDALLATLTVPEARLGAYTIAARAANELGDIVKTESYLVAAETEVPDDPAAGLLRHAFAIARGDAAAADAAADALAKRFEASPQVLRLIVATWFEAGAPEAALAFLDRGISGAGANAETAAAYGFYKAVLLLEMAQDAAGVDAAVAVLDETERRFKDSYQPEDPVFAVIEEIRADAAARKEAFTAK